MKNTKVLGVLLPAVVLVIVLAILIPPGIFFTRMYLDNQMPRQGIDEMKRDFEENSDTILIVRDYFLRLEYAWLVYPPPTGERGVMFAEYAPDLRLALDEGYDGNAVRELLRLGYRRIEKRGGFISFIRWGNTSAGVGIVYATDGYVPISVVLQFLTVLEPMEEEGWFYFEVNFNEYRRRNRNN